MLTSMVFLYFYLFNVLVYRPDLKIFLIYINDPIYCIETISEGILFFIGLKSGRHGRLAYFVQELSVFL